MPSPPGRMVAAFKIGSAALMRHKLNAAGRHHIPKTMHVVMNWCEYQARLRSAMTRLALTASLD